MDVEEIKRHSFFIGLGVILLGVIGWYFVSGSASAEQKEREAKKVNNLYKKISKIKVPTLPTKGMINSGKATKENLKNQALNIVNLWPEAKDLPAPFDEGSTKNLTRPGFDQWKNERGAEILKLAKDGGLSVYKQFEKEQLFKEEQSTQTIRPQWRMRLMVVNQIVKTLTTKTADVTVERFQSGDNTLSPTQVKVGAVALENLEFDLDDKSVRQSLNRSKLMAIGRSGETVASSLRPRRASRDEVKPKEPYKLCTVELTFTSHLTAVPNLVKNLENNSNYFAELIFFDMERASEPYPTEKQLAELTPGTVYKNFAGGELWNVNSHYNEGLMRVRIKMALYRFDKAVGKELVVGPAPAPAQ